MPAAAWQRTSAAPLAVHAAARATMLHHVAPDHGATSGAAHHAAARAAAHAAAAAAAHCAHRTRGMWRQGVGAARGGERLPSRAVHGGTSTTHAAAQLTVVAAAAVSLGDAALSSQVLQLAPQDGRTPQRGSVGGC